MKLFDLHCDTIERMEELGENMLTDKTQLSLKYLPEIENVPDFCNLYSGQQKRRQDADGILVERVRALFSQ